MTSGRSDGNGHNWKFLKYLEIWGTLQMHKNLGNFTNIWEPEELPKLLKKSKCDLFFNYSMFLKCLAIWKIS